MGRFTAVALLLAQLVVISLACFSDGGGGRRPVGVNQMNIMSIGLPKIHPDYNSQDGTVGIGIEHRFRRSIENETVHNVDISRKLFEVLDLNGDDQLDVKEWFDDGGKVRPFSDMLGDHDNNSDEMISLEEFLAIPVDPALIVAIDQMMRGDQD